MAGQQAIVRDRNGAQATLEDLAEVQDGSQPDVHLRLSDGRRVIVPKSALRLSENGVYTLDMPLANLTSAVDGGIEPGQQVVVPVVREELSVGKREVETGRVRVVKTVHEREEVVDEPLLREQVQVERVPINKVVQEPVSVRYEGDTLVIPVYEEVLVVEKRLLLKEEIHVHKTSSQERYTERVPVREEQVSISRADSALTAPPSAPVGHEE